MSNVIIDFSPDALRDMVTDGPDEWIKQLHDSDLERIAQEVVLNESVWEAIYDAVSLAVDQFMVGQPEKTAYAVRAHEGMN